MTKAVILLVGMLCLSSVFAAIYAPGPAKGFYPRVFRVNEQMTLATGFPWNNR